MGEGEKIREEDQQLRNITQLVSQQLKSVVSYKIRSEKAEGDYLAFEGKPDSLKFVSTLSLKAKQPEGFVFVIYEFERKEDGGSFILYEQRVLNRDFFEEKPKEDSKITLLEGVSNVRFEYFRDENKDKNWKEEWVNEWYAKEEKELPKALKITITKKDKKGDDKEIFIIIETSLPANRYEEVRGISPHIIRRVIPGRIP